jgi:hypothetical protein
MPVAVFEPGRRAREIPAELRRAFRVATLGIARVVPASLRPY